MADKIQTVTPSTNNVIYERKEASISEAQGVLRASTQAFSSWKDVPFRKSKDIVSKAVQLLQKRKELVAEELTLQMGRPIAFGKLRRGGCEVDGY